MTGPTAQDAPPGVEVTTVRPGAGAVLEAEPLDVVLRNRRASLRSAMGRVESAVAAPARGEHHVPWLSRVVAEVGDLRHYFIEHLAGTEGPTGYYQTLLADAPRLHGAVKRLVAEHRRMSEAFERVEALERRAAVDRAAVEDLREEVVGLLVLFARHRQHGSDLLWEAYGFDVGGEA